MLAAVAKGHTACVERLVRAGARHLTVNNSGDSPLSLAAAMGNLEVVDLLLPLPGAVALLKKKNAKGVHAVAVATTGGHLEMLRRMIAAGADLGATDGNECTPLALAAWCGHAEMVQLLLETGKVDVECEDSTGATPLWLAAAAGREEAARLLLTAGARPDARPELGTGPTPLEAAPAPHPPAPCSCLLLGASLLALHSWWCCLAIVRTPVAFTSHTPIPSAS